MAIFNSYVCLPEGKAEKDQKNDHSLAEFVHKPGTRQHACRYAIVSGCVAAASTQQNLDDFSR